MFPLAQVVVSDPAVELVTQILAALQNKNWYLLGVLSTVAAVAGVRKIAGKVAALKFFTTDRGGAVLALAAGLAGALGVDAANGTVELATLLDGVVLGISSAGGYTVVRRILWPADANAPQPVVEEVQQ